MKSHYTCTKCKEVLEASTNYFFPSNLKMADKNPNINCIGQCKICAKEYHAKYTLTIKEKKLTRNQRKTTEMAQAIMSGTIYIIGPDIPGTPYKIGVTSGWDTRKRKCALQTAHWIELKQVWKSDVISRADKIEKKLHKHFEHKWVRGEWFKLNKKDIATLPKLVEQFGAE